MNKQVLTIKQMQELIDMGVDVSNASMCYCDLESDEYHFGSNVIVPNNATLSECGLYRENLTPTFTLQDIIDILPESIEEDTIGRFDYELRIKKDGVTYESFDALDSNSEPFVFDEYYIDGEEYKTVLDCAFEMLKSLKTLKKI